MLIFDRDPKIYCSIYFWWCAAGKRERRERGRGQRRESMTVSYHMHVYRGRKVKCMSARIAFAYIKKNFVGVLCAVGLFNYTFVCARGNAQKF